MIGDSYKADVLGGIRFGMSAILFNFHKINTESKIISIDNLLDLKLYL